MLCNVLWLVLLLRDYPFSLCQAIDLKLHFNNIQSITHMTYVSKVGYPTSFVQYFTRKSWKGNSRQSAGLLQDQAFSTSDSVLTILTQCNYGIEQRNLAVLYLPIQGPSSDRLTFRGLPMLKYPLKNASAGVNFVDIGTTNDDKIMIQLNHIACA